MGTYYAVTLVGRPSGTEPDQFHRLARGELDRVEALMSTYRPDSEVGRINTARHSDWLPVSPETANVIRQALEIGRLSGGVYDITAGPLVNLWGFGPAFPPLNEGGPGGVPSDGQIASARTHVGLDKLEVRLDPPAVRKLDPLTRIDLASIAKGFAVDLAGKALEQAGVADYCVDAGGEVRARGLNPDGTPWQVAIESPQAHGQSIHRVIPLRDRAIATSGDYRIFLADAGTRYPHIIDPRTGYPIRTDITSVTVIDPSCARADAWATALMAAGPQTGYELALRERLAALFLLRGPGSIEEKRTTEFDLQS